MSTSPPSFTSFLPSQMGGIISVHVFAVISTLALLSVALRAAWLAAYCRWGEGVSELRDYNFFNTQLGKYAACLLIGHSLNGVAGLIGFSWIVHHGIAEGITCRSQAVIMQVGNLATAYFTVSIAVHTFNSLVLQRKQSVLICRTTILLGWTMAIVIALIPFMMSTPSGFIYGADGFSCGATNFHPRSQFFIYLLPIFIASILSALLYSLIFLALRGTLGIKGGLRVTLNPNKRWEANSDDSYLRFITRVAKSMLWYPVAYITLLVPYSVARLLLISQFKIPPQVVVLAYTCWFSLGIVDVLLLYNTLRILGPAVDARSSMSTRKDLESFAPRELKLPYFGEQRRSALEEQIYQYRYPKYDTENRESGFSTIIANSTHSKNDSDHTFVDLASPEPVRHKGYPEYQAKWMNHHDLDTISPSRKQHGHMEKRQSSSDGTTSPLSLSHFPSPPHAFAPNHASVGSWTSQEEYDYDRTTGSSNQGSPRSPISTFVRSQPFHTVYPGNESSPGRRTLILSEGSRYPFSSGNSASYLPSVQ